MNARMAIFFVAVLGALTLLVVYVVRRASWAAGLGPRARNLAIALGLSAVFLPFVARFAGLVARDVADGLLVQVGFGVGLTVIIAGALLLPLDALRGIARRLAKRRATREAPSPSPEREPTPRIDSPVLTRRELLERAAIGTAVAAGASTSLYGIALGRHDYVVEQVPIPLRGLPRTLDGYTIAQLSDLHVGTFVGERELAAAVDLVRSARPDLIVLTGDLVDHDPRFAELLGRFARRLGGLGARDGVVAIAGNHDYYSGIDDVLGALRRADVSVLRNDARWIGDRGGSFALLGIDDVWAERNGYGTHPDLDAALRAIGEADEGGAHERDRARVLLCHNPEYFPQASDHVDLQISGHTHGGQVNLLIRPADLVLPHGYVSGHYWRGASQVYVNRGFGTAGPPARVGSPPEISRIVLTSA